MAVDLNSEDAVRIRKLVPLATLPAALFNELCKEVSVEEIKDMPLFEKGDTDNHLVYLIDGEVALQSEGLVIDVISSGHEASKFALAHQLPRKIDAVAKGVVRFLRFETERINKQPQLECIEQNEMKVEEEAVAEDRSDDWMTVFLREPIYQRLPPANLQKILISLEEVSAKKGKVIIAQGEAGDYFYFLKCGQCTVSRRPSPGAREVRLGVMEKGETFGEDALITDMPCMVSITAMTDVVLLRLNKKQFIDLIKTPSLNFISYENLSSLQHDMILLDIRPSDEFLISHLDGSINMPFFSLRMQYKSLNREKKVIVICRDGRISEAGAFFLLKQKFKAVILKSGMASVPEVLEQATGDFLIEEAGGTMNEEFSMVAHEVALPLEESSLGVAEQLQQYRMEIETLKRTVIQLNEKCNKMNMEKKGIEDRFELLSKNFEQLKQVLKKLKKTNEQDNNYPD